MDPKRGLIKSHWNHGQEPPIWYYRTKEKEEVDLIIEKNGRLYPIEIKLSARIAGDDLQGLKSLERTNSPLGKGVVLSASSTKYPATKNITVVPYTIIESF